VQQVHNAEKSEHNKGGVMTGYSEIMTPDMARKKLPEGNPLPTSIHFQKTIAIAAFFFIHSFGPSLNLRCRSRG
jgi:hypothetical protein